MDFYCVCIGRHECFVHNEQTNKTFTTNILNNKIFKTREEAWAHVIKYLCDTSDYYAPHGQEARVSTYQWLKKHRGDLKAKELLTAPYDMHRCRELEVSEFSDDDYIRQIHKCVWPWSNFKGSDFVNNNDFYGIFFTIKVIKLKSDVSF